MTTPLQESSNLLPQSTFPYDKPSLTSSSPSNLHHLFEFSSPSIHTNPSFHQQTTLIDAINPHISASSSIERHKITSANMIYSSPAINQALSTALLNNTIYSPSHLDTAELLSPSGRIQISACISEPISAFQRYLGVNFHPKSEHLLKILNEYTHSRNVKSSEEALYNGVAMCFMEQLYLTEISELLNSSLKNLFTSEEWVHSELYGFFAYIKGFQENPGNKDLAFYDAIAKDQMLYIKGVAAFREVMKNVLTELDTEKKKDPAMLFNWLNEYDFLTQEILSKMAHLLHCKIRIIIVSHLSFMEETFFFAEKPENTAAGTENSYLNSDSGKIREYTVLYDFTSDKSYLLYNEMDQERKPLLETIFEAHDQETIETPTDLREHKNNLVHMQALNWLRNIPKSPFYHEPIAFIDKENLSPSPYTIIDKPLQLNNESIQNQMQIKEDDLINSEQFTMLQNLMNKYRNVKEQIDDISGDLKKFDMTYAYGGLENRDMNASAPQDTNKGLNPIIASVLQGFVFQNELLKVQLEEISHTIHELRDKGTAKGAEIKGLMPTIDHERVRSRQNSIMQSFVNKNELAKIQIDELSSVLTKLEGQKLSSNFASQSPGGLMSSQTDTEYVIKGVGKTPIEISSASYQRNYDLSREMINEQRTFTEPEYNIMTHPLTMANESQSLVSQATTSEALLEEEKVNNMSNTSEGRRPRISVEAHFPNGYLTNDITAPISAPLQHVDSLIKLLPVVTGGSATLSSGDGTGFGIEKEILEENMSSGISKIEESGQTMMMNSNSMNSSDGLEPKGKVATHHETPKHGGQVSPPMNLKEESPESKKNNMEMFTKAEKWLASYKTPEKGIYMQTEVQTPNRFFGTELDISKRKSCRSTSPKKSSRETVTSVLPMNLKAKFENVNKKLEKNNSEFNFMVDKRMTQSKMDKTCDLGEIFGKYNEIMENKKTKTEAIPLKE